MSQHHRKIRYSKLPIVPTISTCLLVLTLCHGMVLKPPNEGTLSDASILNGGILLVQANGRNLTLFENCSGGVVFRSPVIVDQVCTKGSAFLRKLACSSENETLVLGGSAEEVTCQKVADVIQSVHFVGVSQILIPTTSPNKNEPIDSFQDEIIKKEPIDDLMNNVLIEKRQVPNLRKTLDGVGVNGTAHRNGTQRNGVLGSTSTPKAAEEKTTTPKPRIKIDTLEKSDNGGYYVDVDEEENDSGSSEEQDTQTTEPNLRVPALFMSGDTETSFRNDNSRSDLKKENKALIKAESLPKPGTLQYDVMKGGLDKWFPSAQSSHIINSQVNLLNSLILSELTGGGCSSPKNCTSSPFSSSDSHSSAYSILYDSQPGNETWYKVLEQIALIADSLIPPALIPNRFSSGETNKAEGAHGFKNGANQFKSQFFHDVLKGFGHYMRSLTDKVMDIGLNGEDQRGFWIDDVIAGLASCRMKGGDVQKRIKLVNADSSNCDEIPELEAFQITIPEWNETSKDYDMIHATINYISNIDPNSYLPPLKARINPKSWIFAEILWYSVQLSYAFCYKELSESNPNAFMMTFAKMIKLFETDVVQDWWSGGMSMPGGKLEVFENLLPFVAHSAPRENSKFGNGDDFRRMLMNLDMISFALHKESVLDHWMQKPQRRKKLGRAKRSNFEVDRERMKRDIIPDFQASEVISPSENDEMINLEVPLTINEFVIRKHKPANQIIPAVALNNDGPILGLENEFVPLLPTTPTEPVAIATSTEQNYGNMSQENKSGLQEERTTPAGEVTGTTVGIAITLNSNPTTTFATEEPKNATTASTTSTEAPSTVPPTGSMTSTVLASTMNPTLPSTISGEIDMSYYDDDDDDDFVDTATTTIITTPTTSMPEIISSLKEYEIWDGLAYCLTLEQGETPSSEDWGNVKPSISDFFKYGVCKL